MSSQIPPEGDEYNKEREEQLYAGITNRTMLQRRYVEMVGASAPPEQISECLSAIAQTDKDISRLSLELHNSTQGRNLNIFMRRMEAALQEHEGNNTLILAGVNNNLTLLNATVEQMLTTAQRALTVAEDGAARLGKITQELGKLVQDVLSLNHRMDDSQADRKQIHQEVASVKGDVAEVKGVVEDLRREIDTLKQARGDGQ